nr:protein windpipe [Danaus plexippus plexippus]
MWWFSFFFFAATLLLEPTLSAVCPDSCVCSTTRDGLHRVTCSNLGDLYKYTLRQKHHNINILDLSHNNISKITHELDRLTEVVTLDLSTNGLTEVNKFLHNAKKLVHLNLAHNRIQRLSLSHLPTSVSSLDLTNNLLKDVPSELGHLPSLEHLELEGNPLDCSCANIIARNQLLAANTYIDAVKCESPMNLKGRSWLELKTKEVCKVIKPDYLDMMMGDQPIDAIKVGEETTALKPNQPFAARSDLDEGKIIQGAELMEDDDSLLFMKVGRITSPSPLSEIEGSGEAESTTISDFMEPIQERKMHENLMKNEEIIPADNIHTTEAPTEGSGEGSGYFFLDDYEDTTEQMIETTTPIIEELSPDPVHRIFNDDLDTNNSEFPVPEPPNVYAGGPDWHIKTDPEIVTKKAVTVEVTRDTTVSEQIRVTQASEVLGPASVGEENEVTHKTGTYVCIALIIVLLVGLIGFAIAKGQMRKRRDRRLLRQQKRDVEKASKEMVDMNKSLLGKPAPVENPSDKKVNGKYELVPTHESYQKKNENGDMANGIKHDENQDIRTDSPRDTNQNKSSSIDNNLSNQNDIPQQETSFESNNSRKDTNSLSSEDIFVPINDDDNPRLNGNLDLSQPLINGDPVADSDYLSPSREYVPVYSPDMGRVRIKMTEVPKPKTPVLVTRSRSNAGDIIITPSLSGNATQTTT